MSTYTSDQEQMQMIKNWWKENGRFTIIIVVLTVMVSYGWKTWQQYNLQKTESASIIYEQMLNAIANHKDKEFENHAENLINNFPNTPYASIAALSWGKAAIDQKSYQVALEKLDWVVKHGKGKDLQQIGRIREARLLLALKNYQQALDILSVVNARSYLPLIEQIRGDIYTAMDKQVEAKKAYQSALSHLPKNDPGRSLVQMKYDRS